jgi:serine/threonine-protein kinase RIM15
MTDSQTSTQASSASTSTSPRPRDPESLSQSTHSNRRHSRAFFDDPPAPDPFLNSLHELTAIATDICEASISTLTSQPKACHELVAKVRSIGNAWDDHPDWPGRNWHMQVLLALASLTRVVEWWEAENKFWNFTDENDGSEIKDGEDESFVFVFKPEAEDRDAMKTPAVIPDHPHHKEQDAKALMVREEFRTRFSPAKPSSLSGRRSRDEDTIPMLGLHEGDDRPSKMQSEASRVQATEALRETADFVRYTTIVLELALDGDQVISANPAWQTVVGYVLFLTQTFF